MTIRKLKPFDIQKFRKGKPAYFKDEEEKNRHMIQFVAEHNDYLWVMYKGGSHTTFNKEYAQQRLAMLPEVKEGWINLYKTHGGVFPSKIYGNEEKATSNIIPNNRYFKTIKISWEES